MKHLRYRLLLLAFVIQHSAFSLSARAEFASGKELQRRLAAPVAVTWSGLPLRQALTGLSRMHGLAVVLDRRVDPERLIEFSAQQTPLEQVCEQLAERAGLGFALVGPVAYFGPRPTAETIRTLVALRSAEAQKLPVKVRAPLLTPQAWKWDDLATPRELLQRLAAEAGAQLRGLDRVPHDLWAGAVLPPTSLVERLTLVLAQYDLTFRVEDDGRTIALAPLPAEIVIERRYPGGKNAAELAANWSRKIPRAKIEVAGTNVVVRSRLEDHEQLTRPAALPRHSPAPQNEQHVYTLKVNNHKLGGLLESSAKAMKLELKIDREAVAKAGISLDQLVSLDVDHVSTETLYKKLLNPVGLDARVTGRTLEVFPQVK